MARPQAGRPRDAGVDEAVLAAARERLSVDGYSRMTVEDVARDAGVTRPTVYRRWPSKFDLAIAAIESIVAVDSIPTTGDVREDLMALARSLHRGFIDTNYGGLLGSVLAEREHNPQMYEMFREKLARPRRRVVREAIQNGIEAGQVKPDTDVDAVVAMFVGAYYAQFISGDKVDGRWDERLVATILAAIATESAS